MPRAIDSGRGIDISRSGQSAESTLSGTGTDTLDLRCGDRVALSPSSRFAGTGITAGDRFRSIEIVYRPARSDGTDASTAAGVYLVPDVRNQVGNDDTFDILQWPSASQRRGAPHCRDDGTNTVLVAVDRNDTVLCDADDRQVWIDRAAAETPRRSWWRGSAPRPRSRRTTSISPERSSTGRLNVTDGAPGPGCRARAQ